MRRILIAIALIAIARSRAVADDRNLNPFIFSPDNLFVETHYEVGFQSVSELTFGGGSASGMGIHLNEHNGILSRMPYMLMFMLAGLQAGGDVRLKSSYSTTPTESEYISRDSKGREIDRTKISGQSTTISATVVPLTEEEKKQRDAHMARMGASLGTMAQMPSHFDLTYFPQRDSGQLRGLRGAIYPVALGFGRSFELALGYAGAHLKAESMDPATGVMRTIKHRSRAIGVRVGFAPARFLVVTAEWQPNLLDWDDSDGRWGSTVRATAAVSIPRVERLFGKVGAERIGLGSSGQWSTFFEGGLRF